MNTRTLHGFAVAISMAAVLALSGCGSSSKTQDPTDGGTPQTPDDGTPQTPDDGTPQTPDDGTPQTPDDGTPQTPDDGTPQTPDDGTPQTPDDGTQALTIPNGLDQSSATPVKASNAGDTLATLLPSPASMFAPLAALVGGDYSEDSPSTELTSELRVKTVSSDGNDGFHVTYTAGGEEQTVHFEAADYLDGQYHYSKVVDGVEYFLATHTDSFERADKDQGPSGYRYFDHNQFGIHDEDGGTVERELHVVRRSNRYLRPARRRGDLCRIHEGVHVSQGQPFQRSPRPDSGRYASDGGFRRRHPGRNHPGNQCEAAR